VALSGQEGFAGGFECAVRGGLCAHSYFGVGFARHFLRQPNCQRAPLMAKADPASGTIPLAVAARLIMVDERHVQRLVASGWIPQPYTVAGVVQGYIRWLKARKSSKSAGDEDIRRERARALKMANDETERLLVRTDDAMASLDAVVGVIRSDLAGVAARATHTPAR
jgi:hypothetical protein